MPGGSTADRGCAMGKAKLARALWRVWHAWGKSWQHGDHADRLRGRDRREWRAVSVCQRGGWGEGGGWSVELGGGRGIEDGACERNVVGSEPRRAC